MKIVKTNWVNLVGVFLTILVFSVLRALTDENLAYNIFQAIAAALVLILGFGIMFWVLFIVLLIILDLILIVPSGRHLKNKLMIEWMVVSAPFVYWLVRYNQWVFLVGILSFLITQFLREKLLKNHFIIECNDKSTAN